MNIEHELENFRFREPPPFLLESIENAVGRETEPPRRSVFWPGAGAAAALLVVLATTATLLDREWTQQTVGHIEPPTARDTTLAQAPAPGFDRDFGVRLAWERYGFVRHVSGEPAGAPAERIKGNGD